MRGVLSLAAAISLPTVLEDGSPFPQRNVIIFLTFCVIFATLVLQGLTLPAVIRKLGLSGGSTLNMEEQQARLLILNTVLDYLTDLTEDSKPEHATIYEDMIRHYRGRVTLIEAGGQEKLEHKLVLARYERNLTQELRALERSTAVILRNEDRINDELLRVIERELDLSEARYQNS
jgi:CPA1 family monovalent cation:H+ antiporter